MWLPSWIEKGHAVPAFCAGTLLLRTLGCHGQNLSVLMPPHCEHPGEAVVATLAGDFSLSVINE